MRVFVLILTILGIAISNQAYGQIPMNMSPGAVMNHQMQTQFLQERAPWVTSPTIYKDLEPPKSEVLVHEDYFEEETSTQGMLIDPEGNAYIVGE